MVNWVYFDVDDTLIKWGNTTEKSINIGGYLVTPYEYHIARLIDEFEYGNKIVVWSAGGQDWAEMVVNALNLNMYVDYCLQKPFSFYDDLDPDDILCNNMHEKKRTKRPELSWLVKHQGCHNMESMKDDLHKAMDLKDVLLKANPGCIITIEPKANK